jgi:tetratricopeptide (TPR) repeat protein
MYQLSGSVSTTREKLLDQELEELRDSLRTIEVGNLKVNSMTTQKIEERIREVEHERRRGIMGNTYETPAEVSLALGSAYFRNSNLGDAEREYKAAIDVNSKLGEAHNNLAVVYLLTNRASLAVDEIKAAEKAGFRVNPGLKQQVKEAAGR